MNDKGVYRAAPGFAGSAKDLNWFGIYSSQGQFQRKNSYFLVTKCLHISFDTEEACLEKTDTLNTTFKKPVPPPSPALPYTPALHSQSAPTSQEGPSPPAPRQDRLTQPLQQGKGLLQM